MILRELFTVLVLGGSFESRSRGEESPGAHVRALCLEELSKSLCQATAVL